MNIARCTNGLPSVIADTMEDQNTIELQNVTEKVADETQAHLATRVQLIQTEMEQVQQARQEQLANKAKTEFLSNMSHKILTDPTRLKQILLNLCGNSIKFTELGGVTLQTFCDKQSEKIIFDIVDTGIGMTEHKLTISAMRLCKRMHRPLAILAVSVWACMFPNTHQALFTGY